MTRRNVLIALAAGVVIAILSALLLRPAYYMFVYHWNKSAYRSLSSNTCYHVSYLLLGLAGSLFCLGANS